MSLRTRRILFYSLVLLFLIVGTALVFYSRGWRFDFKDRELVQIGGIYLRSRPENAEILLDGQPVKNKAGLLQSGTLIDNLFPGEYEVRLSKEGYTDWQKHVLVLPENVSVFDGIIMVPKKEAEIVNLVSAAFYLEEGDSGTMIIKNQGRLRFGEEILPGDEVAAFPDNWVVTYNSRLENYYLLDLNNLEAEPLNLNKLFTELKAKQLDLAGEVPIRKIYPYPYSSRRFILLTERALYTLDTERLAVDQISLEASDFVVAGNDVVWFGPEGVSRYNLVFRSKSMISDLTEVGLKEGEEITGIGVSNSGEAISLLRENGELWFWENNTLTRLGQGVIQAAFSPDSRKLLFIEGTGVMKFYDRDEKMLFALDFHPENEIEKLIWYRNNAYVIFSDTVGKLIFLEIDDSTPLNQTVIASGVSDFDYSEGEDAIYFTASDGIWRFNLK